MVKRGRRPGVYVVTCECGQRRAVEQDEERVCPSCGKMLTNSDINQALLERAERDRKMRRKEIKK